MFETNQSVFELCDQATTVRRTKGSSFTDRCLATGAMSMAAGEYISVASQRDTEQADVDKERLAQESGPIIRQQELDELAQIYVERGLTERLAREVAVALTEKDAVRAHARVKLAWSLLAMLSRSKVSVSCTDVLIQADSMPNQYSHPEQP